MTTTGKLFNRSFGLANAVQLGISTVFLAMMTFMAIYAAEKFAVGDTEAGFAATSFVLGAAIARLLLSKFVDTIGRRRTLIISLAVFVGCIIAYDFAPSFGWLLAIRIVNGIAFGTANTALTAVVLDIVPATRRSEGLGYFGVQGTIGGAIGPALAVGVHQHFGPAGMFTVLGVIAAITLILVLFIDIKEHPPAETAPWWRFRLSEMLDRAAIPIALVMFLITPGYAIMMAYMAPHMTAEGQPELASIFFVIFALAMMGVRLFIGRLHDRKGDNAVIPATMLSFLLAMVILALTQQPWLVLLAAVFAGIGFGGLMPSMLVAAINRSDGTRTPVTTSTYYLLLDAGIAIGPLVLGPTIAWGGFPMPYALAALSTLVAGVLYWLIHGSRLKSQS